MSLNRIGYTQDGMVFIVLDGDFNGRPIQTIHQMLPDEAMKVSEAIKVAANDILKQKVMTQ
jgi:hypothetical protein